MRKNKEEVMIKKMYYHYFTEYLLFSNQYKKLLEEGLLDVDLKNGYLYELCYFVNCMTYENIYPIFIIERLYEFSSLLEKNIEDEKDREKLDWIKSVIEEQEWNDATEVYNREYISRYATVESAKHFSTVSVRQLEIDIQKDFQYLNMLLMDHKELEACIDADFPLFLNKLMLDFPQVIHEKHLRNKVIRILREGNFEKKEKYIHLFQDKTNYEVPEGFDLARVEVFRSLVKLKKMLASKDIQKELEQTSQEYVYHDSFILAMNAFIEQVDIDQNMMQRESDNLREILFYMRNHIDAMPLYNHKEIVAIINKCLNVVNVLIPTDDIEYIKEYVRRIGHGIQYLFLNSLRKAEVKEYIDFLIAFTPQVFDCLLGKIEKENLMTREPIYESEIGTNYKNKDIVTVIEYLFKNYPRMFFDDTIYSKAEMLLSEDSSFKSRVIKQRIYKIRRNNNKQVDSPSNREK